MDMDDSKFFPVSPFLHFYIYHPFGNTPPEDLLQSVNREVKQPHILSLGCGDIRSCFFTLWNNFHYKHSYNFKGVHFVLNDSSAAVLARNIIFLYLCTQMPTEHNDRVKWVASFWSIWYCHELLPHHKEMLMQALSQLLEWSGSCEAWSSNTSNPLRSLVKFFTPSTLSEIHHVWKMWYRETSTVEDMRRSRNSYFKQLPTELYQDPMRHFINFFGCILFKNLTSNERGKIKQDIEYYYKNGFAFAEEIFGLPLEEPKSANSTFIVRSDGKYNLPCTFTPYRSYFFTFQFSPKNLENFDISFPLLVGNKHFTNHPLLANSVQLFSIWIRSCAEIISQQQYDILFTFQCSDALEFCQQLHKPCPHLPQQFDAIYTSNLSDYLALPSLVLLAMRILKLNGSLFTTTLYYYSESNSSTEFLKTCFGFDSKYLQLLCGVRCLGYENEYSDTISVKPVPYMIDIDTAMCVGLRSFIWRHATSMPLKQVTESHFSSMWSVLMISIVHLLTFFADYHYSCTGTVMVLLQSFASQFDKECYDLSSYHFWSPLCELLLKQKTLQSFMTSLQTEAILHGIHLHLTVSEKNCPFCCNQPVLQTINHYSLIVHGNLTYPMMRGGKYILLAYSSRSNVNVYNWRHTDSNSEVHVIDTFDGSMTKEEMKINFFAPVNFFQEDYCITLEFRGDSILGSGKMERFKIANEHWFNQMKLSCTESLLPPLSLGVVIQHSGNDSSFETVISLSDQTMSALQDCQLTTERCSDTTIRIKVDDRFSDILYPYSVDYNKLTVQLSRRNKKITIFGYRTCHCIYDEEPVFIVNPENVLFLPKVSISKEDMDSLCQPQWVVKSHLHENFSPVMNLKHGTEETELKRTFLNLFLATDKCFFLINKYDGDIRVKWYCLLTVINRVFDMHNKVPALDILYCNSHIDEYTFKAFNPNKMRYSSIELDKAERELCTKIFTKCTAATSPPVTNAIYKSLVKKKVEHRFKRAIIYPLFPNLDEKTMNSSNVEVIKAVLFEGSVSHTKDFPYYFRYFAACLRENKCSYCKCTKEGLMKCSKCRLVQYCDTNCQKKHWKTHKPFCSIPKTPAANNA